MNKNELRELFYELVEIQSDTGTELEKDVEAFIHNWLGDLDYFKENPELYGKYQLSDDPLGRSVVWGLRRGDGPGTVILLHHHDVVDSYDYGRLKDLAYNPEKLIEKISDADINQETRDDLESGKWIFGRGTADMKAAGAIHMLLLKDYSELEEFNGNLLFLSVPDEESLSQGAREGASLLKKLKDKHGLQYLMCVDGEPHERDEKGRAIFYEGSVGKTMVVVYVRGRKTHLGHIFQGLNPSHVLSEIVTSTDMNPLFSDVVEGEVSPPPSWSFMRDTKEQYDASIPESAGGYFSVLTLTQTPKDILENTRRLTIKAFDTVIKRINEHYSRFRIMGHQPIESLPWKSNVMYFSEAYQQALEDSGDEYLKAYDKRVEKIINDIAEGKTNIPDSTLDLISLTIDFMNDKNPKVVIAFSPPYYPHIANLDFKDLSEKAKHLGLHLIQYAKEELGQCYARKHYFMGISDLSYVALNNSESVVPYIEKNMPHWNKTYSIPFKDLEEISVPIINIGPWGKDYHKFTERVLREDLLENTPKLTKFAIDYLLSS
ncbi:M20/M25/M40 family metallo-hydrolase [Gudongella sp. DL1XJH-153]|uniref:M20/M25/M40 family metallo-hydrolase n=1 Tax=Gudongella sp. DL1XJH-153 TaxID=3409804 RepID=UPI003BB72607